MTEQEWEETYRKTERRLKKAAKTIACVIGTVFVMAGILWGGYVYCTKYKIAEVTKSTSPDGEYELTLQAVGEAQWPFGSAEGRLLLKEGNRAVSKNSFHIFDDGAGIRESIWKVTWNEDYVEVILSGSEQADEQILLFFDGKTERKNLEEEKENTTGGIRQTDEEATENNGELPQPYAKYVDTLKQIRTEHRDFNGREYQGHPADGSFCFDDNHFAISDVDGDGTQELIFNFSTSNMAGMCEVVYGYDDTTGVLYEKFVEWVNTTYYSNGFVRASFSHNHGKDPEGRGTWPYALYEYDADGARYEIRYYVESWDGHVYEEGFPIELDTDKDGILYYILEEGETVDSDGVVALNQEEYDAWVEETIPEWCRMDVAYRPLTEESIGNINRAYEQAAEFAAQADRWLTGGDGREAGSSYSFYDMDRDGRLELITNLNQGTGRYSENHFYRITGDGEFMELPLVRLCAGEKKSWIANFDLTWIYTEAYEDEAGIIYYEGNDFTREGIFGGYDETGFYYLKEGTVYQDSIRTCSRFTDSEGENEEVHYYVMVVDGKVEEEEITEEEYAALREDYVKDMSPVKVYQNWVYFTADELAVGRMSPKFIACRLLESFLESR